MEVQERRLLRSLSERRRGWKGRGLVRRVLPGFSPRCRGLASFASSIKFRRPRNPRPCEHAKRPKSGSHAASGATCRPNTRPQIIAKISVGPRSLARFSANGARVYTTSANSDQLLAIDTASRSILGRARTPPKPVQARSRQTRIHPRVQPPQRFSHPSTMPPTLQLRASIDVIPQPDEVAIVPTAPSPS